jgi:XTP/dITP diphosphohydrolase
LPIIKAYRIQEKVKGIGFEFAAEDAWKKVDEELAEFHAETDLEKKEKELGDVFFSLINYARISNLNADSALERTNVKFINRFKKLEKLALEKNLNFLKCLYKKWMFFGKKRKMGLIKYKMRS